SSNTNISDNYIHDNWAVSRPDPPIAPLGAGGDNGKTGNNNPPPNTLNIPPYAYKEKEAVMPSVRFYGGGIQLDNTTNNITVIGNNLIDNYYGLKIVNGSNYNLIYHNNFDNSKNGFDAGSD
ncbi:unnamed protein product, partial [marine sediment metagenome]